MTENNKKIENQENEELTTSESMFSKTEDFIDKNKKRILYIVGGLIVVIALIFIYKKSYLAPLEDQAHQEMFMAENYFAKDSFKLALNGDGQYPGFLQIIEEYGSTNAGNLANYYTGICYLRLGQFEEAIRYLKEYTTDDHLLFATANGALGDANLELGKLDDAIKYYKKAAYDKPNQFSSPFYLMKLGFVYEKQEQWEKALEVYEYIDKQYNRTNEGRKIEKYITRVKVKLSKEDL